MPIVTHGHTFMDNEHFDEVAKAIGQCAFVTSDLPVILSLEMHCSPRMQYQLAQMMVQHIDAALLTYEDLVATGRPLELSPRVLQRRVLVKGKAKIPKETADVDTQRLPTLLRSWRRSFALRKSGFSGELCDSGGGCPGLTRLNSELESLSDGSVNSILWPQSPGCRRRLQRRSSANALEEEEARARRKVERRRVASSSAGMTDTFYTGYLGLRSLPVTNFLADDPPRWALPITSMNEDRLLKVLGLSSAARSQIEGLHTQDQKKSATLRDLPANDSVGRTLEKKSSQAVVQLASNPPQAVGKLQRKTSSWLLRPYPIGLRFSGSNMSPLPGWLAGAQHVALNFSDNDTAVQLHYALFDGHAGFVLKPPEMRLEQADTASLRSGSTTSLLTMKFKSPSRRSSAMPLAGSSRRSEASDESTTRNCCKGSTPGRHSSIVGCRSSSGGEEPGFNAAEDLFWPPPRNRLHCMTLHILSLHNSPKHREKRPRYDGSRGDSHKYHPELSGKSSPPDNMDPGSLSLTISCYAFGGFCAVRGVLPLTQSVKNDITTITVEGNGMNAEFYETVHCVAAEPHAAFLRIGVYDDGDEIAYGTAVLARLRAGYRIFQMRGTLGPRIELCYLLVHISFGSEPNLWPTSRQLRIQYLRQMNEDMVAEKVGSTLARGEAVLHAVDRDSGWKRGHDS